MQKGVAVPFILIDQTLKNNSVEYSFKIHPKAHQVFTSDAVRNKKVVIAAVAGPQRTGKSFLSNRLLKRMTGFAVGPTTMPCTKGLWIWGEPIRVSDDTVLIIMDTEGLNSVQRDVNVDMKIFSLSILLSSIFIYNSIGHIDEKALENMSYVLRVSENIKISSDNDNENDMVKYFPQFYWVLRDFSLDLKGKSQNQYLEDSLKAISNDEKDPRNQIRSKIRKMFAHRRCECFPRPVLEENRLAHIQELQYDQLRDNFKNKMKSFQRTFFSNLPAKTINNKPITGSIYLNLAYQYVNAMNSGKVPKIMNSLEAVISSEVRKVCDSYRSNYKTAMDEAIKPQKLPMEQSEIEKYYRHYVSMIEQKLNEKFKIWDDTKLVQDARAKLLEDLNTDLKQRMKQNGKIADISCNKSILKLFEEISLPELKTWEQVTINIVYDKFQQFGRKYEEYVEMNKGSTKYSVFTKKFPKLIFDYFGRFVAKIKGVGSDQLNSLKTEVKNSRLELESVKRIMKEQDNLILQKEKEVEAISNKSNQYKRQLQRNEELTAFEKQSQSMNKNQLRKTLQQLKKQVLELEDSRNQLEDQNQKLINEISSLKINHDSRTNHSIRGQKQSDQTTQVSNLPTDLVELLLQLKGRLSVMNQFYDKKTQDQTLDQYLNRQIQEFRTQKYETIKRAEDEYRHHVEQYRLKIQELKLLHEKEVDMLNSHLDDIKNQNISLRKAITENPGGDQRVKGFIAEKKKFQQSLRMRQIHLNSQIALNAEIERQVAQLKQQKEDICVKLAEVSAAKANLDSFKGSFWYLLRESLNFAMGKKHKLNHAIKSLDKEDHKMLTETFSQVNLKFN